MLNLWLTVQEDEGYAGLYNEPFRLRGRRTRLAGWSHLRLVS